MSKLVEIPRQVRPFALWATPTRSACISKFALTATAWSSDEVATSHGFVELADLLDELAELGADRSILRSVCRALEADRACVIPKMWLTPPQVELYKEPPRGVGTLRSFTAGT
jgi:hypothetical protein